MALLQFLLLLLASGWIAAPDSSLENQLRQEYIGSQRMLRGFSPGNKLSFDSSGNSLNPSPAASWTIAGAVVIEKLRLDGRKLDLQGHRNLVTFDNEHRQLRYLRGTQVSIEIVTKDGPNQASQVFAALAKVFAEKNELGALLPDYWHDYLERFNGTKSGGCESKTPSKGTADVATPPSTTSAEGSGGDLIQRAAPLYVSAARKAGIQGKVQLHGLISKTGTVTNICIVKALGAGLDDSAIDAVRQWKYSPYLQNGQALEVETDIDITFRK